MSQLLLILAFAFFQEIPLKPKEEFEVKLDYQFKQRPTADPNTVSLGESGKSQRTSSGVLPYLILNIRMLALPDEKTRVIITTNLTERPVTKKVSLNTVLALDMGFTDDMIDRVHAHEYTLTFIDADKVPANRIIINVAEDGSFFVNGEKRGKF